MLCLLLVLTGIASAGIVIGRRDSPQITITIVGDIMLSRGVQNHLDEYGYDYPYEAVQELFLNDDLTIANLECPITEYANAADKTKRFVFQADAENAAALARAGVDCLNLANNHTMDYLSEGLYDTMKILSENGLAFVGAVEDSEAISSYVFEKNGMQVGVLAYSALPPEGFFYQKDKASIEYISAADMTKLEQQLAALDCDFTIVYFHWGIEYQPYPSKTQQTIAHRAIDMGADMVVGAHPHVLQGTEIYQDRYIYYSLGNFIFDKQIPPGTDESLILQVTIDKNGLVDINEIPVTIERGKPSISID